MFVFVSVLCVLCVSVVKIRHSSSVAVLHRSSFILHRSHIPHRSPVTPFHRSCVVPARKPTTRALMSSTPATRGHPNRSFSTLRASSISVGPVPLHDMHIFDVIKCNHFYRQLPPSVTPSKTLPMWRNVEELINRSRAFLEITASSYSCRLRECTIITRLDSRSAGESRDDGEA